MSRLPMPKVGLKKATSSIEVNQIKPTKTDEVPAKTKAQLTASLGIKQQTKPTRANENKPPVPGLSRARTLATITRGPAAAAKPTASSTAKSAVKRPATASSTVSTLAAKRARPVGAGIANNTVAGRPLRPTVASTKTAVTKSAAVPKPSKWDWKGRFALANDELITLKEKHKYIDEENIEMKDIIDDLRTKETESSNLAAELKITNDKLVEEFTKAEEVKNELLIKTKTLENELKESQDNYKSATETLERMQKTCKDQERKIREHSSKVTSLESELREKSEKIEEQMQLIKNTQKLLHGLDKERRVLHNTIQEMKGNIRVFCRVRPKIDKETMKIQCSVNYMDECTIEIGRADGSDAVSCTGKSRGTKQDFTFDKIFPPTASQADVFEELSMLVQSALEGYNVCVFAYGQTGSGKTYTMEGGCTPQLEGMIPRTVRHIFKEMDEFKLLGWKYEVQASFLEIYNEHIVDLLDSTPKNHEIRMTDTRGTDLYVTNLKTVEIHSPEELHMWLRTAQQNRAVAATKANDRSSRSHSVARIKLIATHAEKDEMCVGNLNLVDLAGSERLKNEEAARTAETKNINKSLANLGNVILALLKKQDHIPYRNSKLTHLLMPSLGGNSKTLMLLNISPLDECYNETLNSLRFASNVNSCKTGNVKRSKTTLQNPN